MCSASLCFRSPKALSVLGRTEYALGLLGIIKACAQMPNLFSDLSAQVGTYSRIPCIPPCMSPQKKFSYPTRHVHTVQGMPQHWCQPCISRCALMVPCVLLLQTLQVPLLMPPRQSPLATPPLISFSPGSRQRHSHSSSSSDPW